MLSLMRNFVVSQEQEDLSDSEMFKLDEQLAAVFRSMKRPTKKEKKEKRREVGNFRLRALDLLEVIVKGERCGDFAIVSGRFSGLL